MFQLEILTINVISGIVYFCKIILESLLNISETTLWRLLFEEAIFHCPKMIFLLIQ